MIYDVVNTNRQKAAQHKSNSSINYVLMATKQVNCLSAACLSLPPLQDFQIKRNAKQSPTHHLLLLVTPSLLRRAMLACRWLGPRPAKYRDEWVGKESKRKRGVKDFGPLECQKKKSQQQPRAELRGAARCSAVASKVNGVS